jgi:hypothetical protein
MPYRALGHSLHFANYRKSRDQIFVNLSAVKSEQCDLPALFQNRLVKRNAASRRIA